MAGPVDSLEDLRRFIDVSPEEEEGVRSCQGRWGTTAHFAALMDRGDPDCPLRRQVVPSTLENRQGEGVKDYLRTLESRRQDPGRPSNIARLYDDRVAFTVTNDCLSYCRHCFRRQIVFSSTPPKDWDLDTGIAWIRSRPEIRDVLVTGGDPLTLADDDLAHLLQRLRRIPQLEMLRIGTRAPVVAPERITERLLRALAGDHRVPIWLITQCNHPKEITKAMADAVLRLLKAGIPVLNQAVLLKGINDDPATFKELHLRLLSIRVKPYYLHHCEYAPGLDHFRTPLETGADLIRSCLRNHTTGLAEPIYVITTPIGKIPFRDLFYIQENSPERTTLRDHQGRTWTIPPCQPGN